MRSFLPLAVAATLLAACSSKIESTPPAIAPGAASPGAASVTASPGTLIPDAVSGTRLRAKHLVTADGVKSFAGWHDMQRNEDCAFDVAEDGKMRCLPTSALDGSSQNSPGSQQTPQFSDAMCSIPAVPSACAGAPFISAPALSTSCGNVVGRRIYSATKIAAGGSVYGYGGQSGCAATPVTAAQSIYAAGAVVPASSFVEGTVTTDAGDGLVSTHLDTADGARQHLSWHIGSLAADCSFEVMGDGVARCLPAGQSGELIYSDASCFVPAGVLSNVYNGGNGPCGTTTPAGAQVWLGRDDSKGICERTAAVYKLGLETPAPSVFYEKEQGGVGPGSSSSCYSQNEGSYSQAQTYPIGADLTSTLPSAPLQATSSARLIPSMVFASGSRQLVPGFHDSMRDEDCVFAVATDGKTRCLPVTSTATLLFNDAACKGAIMAGLNDAVCDTATPTTALEVSTGTCPATTKVYALGAPVDLTVASEAAAPGTCAKLGGAMHVFPAKEIDPSSFAEGTPATD